MQRIATLTSLQRLDLYGRAECIDAEPLSALVSLTNLKTDVALDRWPALPALRTLVWGSERPLPILSSAQLPSLVGRMVCTQEEMLG